MNRRGGTALSLFVALALLFVLPASAAAKSKPITGKLSKGGYTLIALAESGQAQTVVVKRGKFKLRPPTKTVTLHLRAPNGTYAGPIVAGKVPGKGSKKARSSAKKKRGKKQGTQQVVVGVKAGANLGKIKVKPGKGFAVVKRIAVGSLAVKLTAAATKKGVPIGAGVFGRVSVKKLTGRSSDPERDGIPNPLDIDDDGDLILDVFDTQGAVRASAAAPSPQPTWVAAGTALVLELDSTVNASGGSTSTEINEALSSRGKLFPVYTGMANSAIQLQPDPGTLPELDCAGDPAAVPARPGLSFCSQGGTGRLDLNPMTDGPGVVGDPFPACCDPDGDGFGSLVDSGPGIPSRPPGSGLFVYGRWLRHGATNAAIHTGDLLIARTTIGGVETVFPGVVSYVYATVPALASYTDEAGHSATLSYPVAPGSPGTQVNGFPVADGSDDDTDIEVTLTFWRPQRPAAAGETGEWTDIGKAAYFAKVPSPSNCPVDAYSEVSPELTLDPDYHQGGGPEGQAALTDSAPDRPANSANTFSFKLNLTKCHAAAQGGAPPFSNPGDVATISFSAMPFNAPAPGRPDEAQTSFHFERQ